MSVMHMSNNVADCEYCEEGLVYEGFSLYCDKCGRKNEYPVCFEPRIDNGRYRKRIGLIK